MEEDQQYEERKTPAGFLVKVRLTKLTYVVFTPRVQKFPRGLKIIQSLFLFLEWSSWEMILIFPILDWAN